MPQQAARGDVTAVTLGTPVTADRPVTRVRPSPPRHTPRRPLEAWAHIFESANMSFREHRDADPFVSMHHMIGSDVLLKSDSGFSNVASLYSAAVTDVTGVTGVTDLSAGDVGTGCIRRLPDQPEPTANPEVNRWLRYTRHSPITVLLQLKLSFDRYTRYHTVTARAVLRPSHL